ncbi:MAG: hypothetical protein R6U98_01420, partial [Pirellulaceae bacterium]
REPRENHIHRGSLRILSPTFPSAGKRFPFRGRRKFNANWNAIELQHRILVSFRKHAYTARRFFGLKHEKLTFRPFPRLPPLFARLVP